MAKWTDLLYKPNKFETAGYEYVQMQKVLNKTVTVVDYDIYDSTATEQGVRILVDCKRLGKKVFTATSGKVVVAMFRDHPEEIKQLIDSKTPVKFVNMQSTNGNRYLTVEDVDESV